MIRCVFGGFTTGLQIGETCNFRLWVVLLLDFFDDIVNPPQLQEAVTKARNSLKEEGFQNDGPVFLAGHSLGGTFKPKLYIFNFWFCNYNLIAICEIRILWTLFTDG